MVVSWGLSARVKWSDVVGECTGYKLEDKRSVKLMYSRLIILLRSFCGNDGKPGSVTFVGGGFPGVVGAKASSTGAVETTAAFPAWGLGPGGTREKRPSWFSSPACSCGSYGRPACELAGERRETVGFGLASTGARCSEPTASAISWRSWVS